MRTLEIKSNSSEIQREIFWNTKGSFYFLNFYFTNLQGKELGPSEQTTGNKIHRYKTAGHPFIVLRHSLFYSQRL